jgi:transposase
VNKSRRKIDAALTAKIALRRLESSRTVADRAQQHEVQPNQIYALKK